MLAYCIWTIYFMPFDKCRKIWKILFLACAHIVVCSMEVNLLRFVLVSMKMLLHRPQIIRFIEHSSFYGQHLWITSPVEQGPGRCAPWTNMKMSLKFEMPLKCLQCRQWQTHYFVFVENERIDNQHVCSLCINIINKASFYDDF